ncbi:MAG: hypothetical protein FJW68_03555 [Actinobacteria bacterium]|nr:hypothetical protein [Actinomycetota bacterium]
MPKTKKTIIKNTAIIISGKKRKPLCYVFIIALFLGFLFLISACGSPLVSPEKIEIEEARSEETKAESTAADPAQDLGAIEEELPADINYQGLETGAEMTGYIPSFLCTDRNNYIRIDITNTSGFAWRNKRPGIVRIGYHYYGQDVDFVDYDRTARTELPGIVNPGETVSINVLINDIVNPGYYIIQIDPVIEGNTIPEDNFWFSSKGVKMIEGLSYFNSCLQ